MATNIGTAFFNVTFNTAAARREVTALVSNINRNFGLLGGAAIVGATAAIAGLIRATFEIGEAALQASIEYEQAFASVRKTVDDGTLSASEAATTFGNLNKELRGLALEVPLDLEEDIANVAALGGQLGIPAENLTEFTRIIGELGVTTNVAVEDAATSFARLANIMGLGEEDFRNLGDTVVNLGNKLPAQEDEILRFANRIAAAGEIAGFSADEVLAVGAAMASVGVPSERGGTAIQRTWIKITDAVANGGEVLDLIAKVSGETSEDFARHWETDAAGAWTSFIEGLGATGTDAFGILRDLGLNDQRVIQSLLSISNAGDLMRTTFGFAKDDMGALRTESELFFNTTEGQIQLFQNRLHDVSITIGDEMKPAFRDILVMVNDWIEENPELIDQLGRELRSALVEVGEVIGRILPIAEDLLDLLPDLVKQTAEWAGPLVDVAGRIIEVGNAFVTLREQVSRQAEGGSVLDQVVDQLMTGAIQGLPDTIGRIQRLFDLASVKAPDPSQWNIFWRAFFPPTAIAGVVLEGVASLGDETAGTIEVAGRELLKRLEAGENPTQVALDSFVQLQKDIRAIDPDATIPTGFFGAFIQETEMARDEAIDLWQVLRAAGVDLQGISAVLGEGAGGERRSGPRGGRGGGRETAAQIMLQDWEDVDAATDAIAVQIKTKLDAATGMREIAEGFGVSIDVILDHWERLAPGAAAVMDASVEGMGEATFRAELFGQTLRDLKESIDFRPATQGMFGVGDIIEGIDLVTRTIEGAKGEADRTVRVTAAEYTEGIRTNLNQIARFEANLLILFAQGHETLAAFLRDKGPEVGAIARDYVNDFQGAAETEALLMDGGVIPEELQKDVDEVLAGAPPSQGLLDFIATFGSDQVLKRVYDEAFKSGQQYGSGLTAGLIASLAPWVLALLGVGTSVNAATGFTIIGATPSVPTTPPRSINPSTGFVINQTFYETPGPNTRTHQAAQQAAAILAGVRGV